MIRRPSALALAAFLLALAASAQQAPALRATAQQLFGSISPVRSEEVQDPEAVLGRALFWDTRLSANGQVACASCHPAAAWGADARRFSVNARGKPTGRNAQSIFNSQSAPAGLRWVGDRDSGAAQAIGSITGSMGFDDVEDIVPVLLRNGYRELFSEAFPDDGEPVSPDNYGRALQAYQETLRTPAPFDRWLDGDDGAMTPAELSGLERFVSIGCASCHSGPLLGGTSLQRFGVVEDFRPHTGSSESDRGLMSATDDESDRDVFRVQPLRNVSRTAPYFHDGSVPDLETAIRVMARVQLGTTLTDAEIEDLVAFLRTLDGEVPAQFAPPSSFPLASSQTAND